MSQQLRSVVFRGNEIAKLPAAELPARARLFGSLRLTSAASSIRPSHVLFFSGCFININISWQSRR